MYISYTLEGFEELQDAMSEITGNALNRIVNKAAKESQDIVLKEAKKTVMQMVGGKMGALIAGALKLTARKKLYRGQMGVSLSLDNRPEFFHETAWGVIKIRTRKGKWKTKKGRYYIPAAIEYGHRKPYGEVPQEVPAIPFMRRADDNTRARRVDRFRDVFRELLMKAVIKHRKAVSKAETFAEKMFEGE